MPMQAPPSGIPTGNAQLPGAPKQTAASKTKGTTSAKSDKVEGEASTGKSKQTRAKDDFGREVQLTAPDVIALEVLGQIDDDAEAPLLPRGAMVEYEIGGFEAEAGGIALRRTTKQGQLDEQAPVVHVRRGQAQRWLKAVGDGEGTPSEPAVLRTGSRVVGPTEGMVGMASVDWSKMAGEATEAKWAEAVSQLRLGDARDVNTMVQWVLRESYVENTQDLRFYAEKVKYFNNLKAKIRDELTSARGALADAGQSPMISPPFVPTNIDGEYYGVQEVPAEQLQVPTPAGAGVRLESAPTADPIVFRTNDGHRIEVRPNGWANGAGDVRVFAPGGERLVHIWGDPHVNEGAGGDNWHFGDDSSFILPDGTKMVLDTHEIQPGVFVVQGIDVVSGNDHVFAGSGRPQAGQTSDAALWDASTPDSRGASGGVFALRPNGEWAKKEADGQWYDVRDESWEGYLADKDVDVHGGAVTSELGAGQVQAGSVSVMEKIFSDRKSLEAYVDEMEEKLNSVGDDAQLANVDLQNMLQKQQQTLQMISNISKMLHETAIGVIRKIG